MKYATKPFGTSVNLPYFKCPDCSEIYAVISDTSRGEEDAGYWVAQTDIQWCPYCGLHNVGAVVTQENYRGEGI